jgi:CrcB protein
MPLQIPTWLWIGFGGFLGALSRYYVSTAINRYNHHLPLGTLSVNVFGSFLIGFLMNTFLEKAHLPPELRFFLIVGFLGAFTTFSTFSLDTITLFQNGQWIDSLVNILLNTSLSILAVGLGLYLSKLLL